MNFKNFKRPDPMMLVIYTMAALVIMWLAGVFNKAEAGEAVLSWTHPTQYVDNTPLPIAQVLRTEAQYGLCDAAGTGFLASPVPVLVNIAPPPATTTITGLAPGDWCFRIRTVATTSTTPSNWTGMARKTVVAPKPKPPTGLTIAADTTVYSVVKRVDRFVMVAVGTAAAGTECITTQSVNDYFVVPRASVTWSGNVKPDVVVASCM